MIMGAARVTSAQISASWEKPLNFSSECNLSMNGILLLGLYYILIQPGCCMPVMKYYSLLFFSPVCNCIRCHQNAKVCEVYIRK